MDRWVREGDSGVLYNSRLREDRMRALRSCLALFITVTGFGALAQSAPRISVAGIRVIGGGLGANGSELHAFGEQHPGITIGLAIQAPDGSGIVEIDGHASRVDAFTDSKGRSLLEEGRFGSFPKISED